MADLRRTISDSSSEDEKQPKQVKRRDEKGETKKKKEDTDDLMQMDTNFSLIVDTHKDVSKILRKKEYDLSANQAGNKWNFSKSLTEDQ
jgi:hypothetical protein